MKKNNTTEKSILNAEKLTKALKEGTEKTLQSIINEAIGNLIRENEDEDTEVEVDGESEDTFDVEDVETDETPEVTDTESEENTEEAPESEDEGEGDEWSEYEKFKTDDNDYDFTGEDEDASEKILKIFDMIEDGDEVIVTKDNGKINVSHVDTDADEEIELGLDTDDENDADEEIELGLDTDDENDAEVEIEVDVEPEAEFEPEVDVDDESEKEFEFEIDDKEGLEESTNLGYTDSYQSKTAMTTPPNKEVANPKDTYSMDDVPEGDGKRWAGKGSSEPFSQSVNEEDVIEPEALTEEDELVDESAARTLSKRKAKVKSTSATKKPGHSVSVDGNYYATVVENIKKENEALKEGIKSLKKSIKEAAVLNVNLGRIVNLLVNETTTREEKKSILKRFNNVKTINEGADLYNTIKSELNESKKSVINIDNEVVTTSKTKLNETTIYQDRTSNPSLSLMDRMDNLYRK